MDVIVKGRRYILGETETHFGIWDVHGGEDPIETFPLTAEGFDEAGLRFSELKRLKREPRGLLPRGLWRITGVGVAMWTAGGVLWVVLGGGLGFGLSPSDVWVQAVQIVDNVGYRLAVGAVLLLVALVVVRWDRAIRSGVPPLVPLGGDDHGSRLDTVLRFGFLGGLGLWVPLGVAVQALAPRGPLFFEAPEPPLAYIWAAVLEAVAFRVWVASLILLVLRWGQRHWAVRQPAATEAGDPDPDA